MSNKKLNFNKFRISKLTGIKNIIGGSDRDNTHTTTNNNTDAEPPPEPKCILTSKEVIEN